MLEFSGVTKTYGTRINALTGINCKISRGEFVMITGESGAGKSTFLKLIYGAEKPSSGKVLVGGNVVVSMVSRTKLAYLRRRLGIVFQDFKLLWDRSVQENVALPLYIAKKDEMETAERVERIMSELDLWKYKNLYPYQLSGGEQQKVSIARAMVTDPWIIIADEPTGNLDPKSTDEIFSLFQKAAAKGTTTVFATHNERLVTRHSGRVIQLDKGRIVKGA
jgi:cell division transport system ATP-binding protein